MHYLDGSLHVLVETGMPQDPVYIGLGDTIEEARESLESTPVQSVGPDCGLHAALRWAHNAGWISDPDDLEPAEEDEEEEEEEEDSDE